jgi:TldD protein
MNDLFTTIDFLSIAGENLLHDFARSHRGTDYADIRFEVVYSRAASAENGAARESLESESASFGVSVQFAGHQGVFGNGQSGATIGRLAMKQAKLTFALKAALEEAYERARRSAREKATMMKALGAKAAGLIRAELAPVAPVRDRVAAVYRRDPRSLKPDEIAKLCCDASAATVAGLGREIAFNMVASSSELRRELFISLEGALISQEFAFSQGDCFVVAQSGEGHQESYDTIGQQRGLECLSEGWLGELMPNPDLLTFAVELAGEARELAAAPVLKPPAGEVTVVTDPHFNALLAHEIIGHPCEADRALKMEAAYAGRSWLLRSLADNELGRAVASGLLSACSDPGLEAYGHYRYEHEGTPGQRVMHIDAVSSADS